jgi:hypothetical protein
MEWRWKIRCALNRTGIWTIVTFDMRYSTCYADPGHKMREHLSTAPRVLSRVTPPSTNGAQHCSTLVIKWGPVCPTWQDAVYDITFAGIPRLSKAYVITSANYWSHFWSRFPFQANRSTRPILVAVNRAMRTISKHPHGGDT